MKKSVKPSNRMLYLCSKVKLQLSKEVIIKLCNEMSSEIPSVSRSNFGGWHSGYKLHLSSRNDINVISRELLETANYLLKKNELTNGSAGIEFTQLWININDKYHWNRPHNHVAPVKPGLDVPIWSGIYYVNVEGEVGDDVGGELILFSSDEKGNVNCHTHKPEDGQLLLFKSNLLHMVSPSRSDNKRISIAFNLKEVSRS